MYQFFPIKSQGEKKYRFAEKRSAPKPAVPLKCKLSCQELPGFWTLRQHKNIQHGSPIKTANVDSDDIINELDDANPKEELRSCQQFLVDSEIERARQKVFNYAIENLIAKIVDEKLDHFFNNLMCAAKGNLAVGFNLKNKEDGGFRYFYAHEINTLLDWSTLVCTRDDLADLKDFLKKTVVIEPYSREGMITMWRFSKLTNLTVFAALLKDVPMRYNDAVLPKPLLKNHTINCLTYEENSRQPCNDNMCLSRALAVHLHGNQRLEEETFIF